MNKIPLHSDVVKPKGPPSGPKPSYHKKKTPNNTGLGKTLMNRKAKEGKVYVTDAGETRYTTEENKEAGWVKLRSVTQEKALDEFLATAELADTDFTAERRAHTTIINTHDNSNPYLLTKAEAERLREKQAENVGKLTVPRRPVWTEETTSTQLDREEKEAFLRWRRSLAELQENQDLLLTPFERNIEVWRQLWRVCERSDLVVQIVDGRNPLQFRSEDLELYVKEIDPRKRNLLLVNKADLMTEEQRQVWADYFKQHGIRYAFFSAAKAKEELEALELKEEAQGSHHKKVVDDDSDDEVSALERELAQFVPKEESEDEESEDEEEEDVVEDAIQQVDADTSVTVPENAHEEAEATDAAKPSTADMHYSVMATPTSILSVDQLEQLFLAEAPAPMQPAPEGQEPRLNIGLVGYPNVGKSSTINALVGSNKVSVSATPGKTKHFQTILLSRKVMLCDCPGLVFPNFGNTNGELVCNGVLPIDQLREFTGPATLVSRRVPKYFLESVYGIKIYTRPVDEGGLGYPTATEFLVAYAKARGYMRGASQGNPDESRAARYVLKDYVNGKILYCHPPPDFRTDLDDEEAGIVFNKGLYTLQQLPPSRQKQLLDAAVHSGIPREDFDLERDIDKLSFSQHATGAGGFGGKGFSSLGEHLDADYFGKNSSGGNLSTPFHQRGAAQGTKKHFKGKKLKARNARGGNDNFGGSYADII